MTNFYKGQLCYIQHYNAPKNASGRMAVIVSGDDFNKGESVVVCYLSRKASAFPYIQTGPSSGAYVVPHPVTVSKDRISAAKGIIADTDRTTLDITLRHVMGF